MVLLPQTWPDPLNSRVPMVLPPFNPIICPDGSVLLYSSSVIVKLEMLKLLPGPEHSTLGKSKLLTKKRDLASTKEPAALFMEVQPVPTRYHSPSMIRFELLMSRVRL